MDDDLRRLERAARERPDDRAAGWAFVRELARTGEPRFHELCRLARLGDVEARDAVERWHPLPGGPASSVAWRRRGPRSVGRARERRLDLAGVDDARIRAATDEVVLLEATGEAGEALVALDLEGTQLWRAELGTVDDAPVPGVLVDDELVHRQGARRVVARDVASGDERAVVAELAFVDDVQADGDRLAISGRDDGGRWVVLAVELASGGPRELWRGPIAEGSGIWIVPGRGELLAGATRAGSAALEVRSLADGAVVRRLGGAEPHDVRAVDGRGAVVVVERRGSVESIREVAIGGGAGVAWAIEPAPFVGPVALAGDTAVVWLPPTVIAFDRASGTVQWRAPRGAASVRSLVSMEGAVIPCLGGRDELRALTLEDGRSLFELTGALGQSCTTVVLDRELIVVASAGEGELRWRRVGER